MALNLRIRRTFLLALTSLAAVGAGTNVAAQVVDPTFGPGENSKSVALTETQLTPNLTVVLKFSPPRVCFPFTDETASGMARKLARNMVDLMAGRTPIEIANTLKVLESFSIDDKGVETGAFPEGIFTSSYYKIYRDSVGTAYRANWGQFNIDGLRSGRPYVINDLAYCYTPAEYRAWKSQVVSALRRYYGIAQ